MKLHFAVRREAFAVVRLEPDSSIPAWATRGNFFSITRSEEELSVMCEESLVPDDVKVSHDWRCLLLRGPFAFTEVGVAAEFASVLAKRSVSVLVVSSFDTDAVLVPAAQLDRAIGALRNAGHAVDDAK